MPKRSREGYGDKTQQPITKVIVIDDDTSSVAPSPSNNSPSFSVPRAESVLPQAPTSSIPSAFYNGLIEKIRLEQQKGLLKNLVSDSNPNDHLHPQPTSNCLTRQSVFNVTRVANNNNNKSNGMSGKPNAAALSKNQPGHAPNSNNYTQRSFSVVEPPMLKDTDFLISNEAIYRKLEAIAQLLRAKPSATRGIEKQGESAKNKDMLVKEITKHLTSLANSDFSEITLSDVNFNMLINLVIDLYTAGVYSDELHEQVKCLLTKVYGNFFPDNPTETTQKDKFIAVSGSLINVSFYSKDTFVELLRPYLSKNSTLLEAMVEQIKKDAQVIAKKLKFLQDIESTLLQQPNQLPSSFLNNNNSAINHEGSEPSCSPAPSNDCNNLEHNSEDEELHIDLSDEEYGRSSPKP